MIEVEEHIDLSLIDGFLRGLIPDPIITVSEWADEYRYLPPESAKPGKFEMRVTPFNKEISDRLSITDSAQLVVFKKSSQVGATETGNNWLGYVIDVAPSSFLYVMPTDALMKKTSKTRIQRMIDTTPNLSKKVAAPRSRDSGNTIMEKYFEGGSATMIGANSPVGLASTPIRFVYMDEIDRYPLNVGGEGSALSLAQTRTVTYGATKKIFLTSTPTIEGQSAIDDEFQLTGQRYYHVPCPHCNEKQVLNFEQLRWVEKEVEYECFICKKIIPERFKPWMLENGKWVPQYPEKEDGLIYGYHINALYSPYGMYSWLDMMKEYEKSKNDVPKMIAFTNTKLGEVYKEDQGDKPDWEYLYESAGSVEKGKPILSVAVITAGVDVQADRLEIEIVGWMKGKTSQSIDFRVIVGDTSQDEVWKQLSEMLNETWVREDGSILSIKLMAVDTGYNTEKVYNFAKQHSVTRVIPIKGREKLDMFFAAPKTIDVLKAGKKIGKVKVWGVGVSLLKSELYGLLKLRIDHDTGEVPNGFCYFPKRDPTYFRGITAEEVVKVENKRHFEEFVWVKKYKRNEPLDCRIYARAASAVVGIDRWSDERWNQEIAAYEKQKFNEKPQPANQPSKPRRSKFWGGVKD